VRISRIKTIAVALSMIVGTAAAIWVGIQPSQAGERHTIWIVPGVINVNPYEAYGDLYARDGRLVYHWQKRNRPSQFLSWGFTDGGDKGWLTLDIQAGHNDTYHSSLHLDKLPLNRDYCFTIGDVIVQESTCPYRPESLEGLTEEVVGE